jgi:predicted DNA-binding transcriptional regulator YafY
VHPYGLVYAGGRWFLIGFCDKVSSIRIFRLDRMISVAVLDDAADIPVDLDVEGKLRGGRAMVGSSEEVLRVSYSPRIARWIAEHGEVESQMDGSVIVEHPLLDDDWAVRHVLQYGADAVVLAPERMRQAVVARLRTVGGN